MNSFLKNARVFLVLAGSLLALLGMVGCGSTGSSSPGAPSSPSPASSPSGPSSLLQIQRGGDVLRVGDPVTVSFSGLSTMDVPPPFSERIKADGMIRLPLIKEAIKAEGKTRGELEDEIRALYVPRLFRSLTVKVASEGRVVHVSGEVRIQGRVQYMGEMTVLRVIAAAGGFTDFASKKKVLVTRASGQKVRVNCIKALEDPKFDLPVFPDDHIEVDRRIF